MLISASFAPIIVVTCKNTVLKWPQKGQLDGSALCVNSAAIHRALVNQRCLRACKEVNSTGSLVVCDCGHLATIVFTSPGWLSSKRSPSDGYLFSFSSFAVLVS